MKKIVFIGSIGCGKTSLGEALLGNEIKYKKTQSVEVLGNCILDTPGEYLERSQMRGSLSILATEVEVIGIVISAIDDLMMFPPCYGSSFAKDVIGIVTKIDIATEEQVMIAEQHLQLAGANRIFRVCSLTGEGIDNLKKYLEDE